MAFGFVWLVFDRDLQWFVRSGAAAGMLAGLGVTKYYLAVDLPTVREARQLVGDGLWWRVQPVSASVFAVAEGLIATLLVSLVTGDAETDSGSSLA